jgi:hypothetical protein
VCTRLTKVRRNKLGHGLSMITTIDFWGRLYLYIVDSWAALVGCYAAFVTTMPVITSYALMIFLMPF